MDRSVSLSRYSLIIVPINLLTSNWWNCYIYIARTLLVTMLLIIALILSAGWCEWIDSAITCQCRRITWTADFDVADVGLHIVFVLRPRLLLYPFPAKYYVQILLRLISFLDSYECYILSRLSIFKLNHLIARCPSVIAQRTTLFGHQSHVISDMFIMSDYRLYSILLSPYE